MAPIMAVHEQALDYVKNQLAQYERPMKKHKTGKEPTLICHMSNNQLRTAIYKAAQKRTCLFRTVENLC
ncbi:unnamed protein product [Macrosiphum euphorbiae]|uniref:Uncharacterized protein n=1 Tax=Macrosiphum euphorbiae TaxID=13131 RepID=A0AAV0VFS1_9HEMI|nr:unnamed protein product [Macrosiphum euphorbiae]